MQKVAHKGELTPLKEVQKQTKNTPIIKELEVTKETRVTVNIPLIIAALAIIFSGVFTGYVLAKGSGNGGAGGIGGGIGGTGLGLAKSVGACDAERCKDTVEGTLREGGTDGGEGTHHIERPGGESQNVYLTSSTVPLDDYVGKEVKVSGETFAAETAGWFMDVAKLELK